MGGVSHPNGAIENLHMQCELSVLQGRVLELEPCLGSWTHGPIIFRLSAINSRALSGRRVPDARQP